MNYFFNKRGFTLTELIVVMSIATIMMATLVIKQGSWNDNLALRTQAYELAMTIRQAQAYSLGVRENATSVGDKFNVGYGVFMDQGHMDRYTFFADKDGDKKYDAGEEIESSKVFNRGVSILKVCGFNGGVEKCFPGVGFWEQVNISFLRPQTNANVIFLNNGGNNKTPSPAKIYLKSSGSGKVITVEVKTNGQVSIQ